MIIRVLRCTASYSPCLWKPGYGQGNLGLVAHTLSLFPIVPLFALATFFWMENPRLLHLLASVASLIGNNTRAEHLETSSVLDKGDSLQVKDFWKPTLALTFRIYRHSSNPPKGSRR